MRTRSHLSARVVCPEVGLSGVNFFVATDLTGDFCTR